MVVFARQSGRRSEKVLRKKFLVPLKVSAQIIIIIIINISGVRKSEEITIRDFAS